MAPPRDRCQVSDTEHEDRQPFITRLDAAPAGPSLSHERIVLGCAGLLFAGAPDRGAAGFGYQHQSFFDG